MATYGGVFLYFGHVRELGDFHKVLDGAHDLPHPSKVWNANGLSTDGPSPWPSMALPCHGQSYTPQTTTSYISMT